MGTSDWASGATGEPAGPAAGAAGACPAAGPATAAWAGAAVAAAAPPASSVAPPSFRKPRLRTVPCRLSHAARARGTGHCPHPWINPAVTGPNISLPYIKVQALRMPGRLAAGPGPGRGSRRTPEPSVVIPNVTVGEYRPQLNAGALP